MKFLFISKAADTFHFYDNDTKATGIIGDIWTTLSELLNFTFVKKVFLSYFSFFKLNAVFKLLYNIIYRNYIHQNIFYKKNYFKLLSNNNHAIFNNYYKLINSNNFYLIIYVLRTYLEIFVKILF